jgi:hypothetical protein
MGLYAAAMRYRHARSLALLLNRTVTIRTARVNFCSDRGTALRLRAGVRSISAIFEFVTLIFLAVPAGSACTAKFICAAMS